MCTWGTPRGGGGDSLELDWCWPGVGGDRVPKSMLRTMHDRTWQIRRALLAGRVVWTPGILLGGSQHNNPVYRSSFFPTWSAFRPPRYESRAPPIEISDAQRTVGGGGNCPSGQQHPSLSCRSSCTCSLSASTSSCTVGWWRRGKPRQSSQDLDNAAIAWPISFTLTRAVRRTSCRRPCPGHSP